MASKSLEGCTICFAGSHATYEGFKGKTVADLKNSIQDCGGFYATKVSECTHLVCTRKQVNSNLNKVHMAHNDFPDVNVVDYAWLAKSFESKEKVQTDPYDLASPSNGTANPGPTTDGVDMAPFPDASSVSEITKRRLADTSRDEDSTVDNAEPKSKKQKSKDEPKSPDTQKAKLPAVLIPIDEGCPLAGTHQVLADSNDGSILDVTLNQTNAGNNNNKFYRIQLLTDSKGDFRTWTRWGRVGEFGQSKLLGSGSFANALSEFEKKFKDKSGNRWEDRMNAPKPGKYTFVERNYEASDDEDNDNQRGAEERRGSKASPKIEDSDAPAESKLPKPVRRLMKLIFNQNHFNQTMASLDYDAEKMPLGKLSKRTLKQGYQILKDIAALMGDRSLAQSQYSTTYARAVEQLSNSYFSTIPHAFGRNRPPVIHHLDIIKKEIDMLENLTDMQLANEIMKTAKGSTKTEEEDINAMDRQFQSLGMEEMTPLDGKSSEFVELQDYLQKAAGSTHGFNYKVQDIFRIERRGENERFSKSGYARVENSDRRLLWHGSRCTNYGGILSQGLRIAPPEAPVSGYMFGKGVYLADISTKSAGYCFSHATDNIGLLLLCEAELGQPPLKLTQADYTAGERAKEAKCISTLGVGRTAPVGWKDAGSVHENLKGVLMPDVTKALGPSNEKDAQLMYNEYIVYDVAQIRLRYLLRVEIGHGFID